MDEQWWVPFQPGRYHSKVSTRVSQNSFPGSQAIALEQKLRQQWQFLDQWHDPIQNNHPTKKPNLRPRPESFLEQKMYSRFSRASGASPTLSRPLLQPNCHQLRQQTKVGPPIALEPPYHKVWTSSLNLRDARDSPQRRQEAFKQTKHCSFWAVPESSQAASSPYDVKPPYSFWSPVTQWTLTTILNNQSILVNPRQISYP